MKAKMRYHILLWELWDKLYIYIYTHNLSFFFIFSKSSACLNKKAHLPLWLMIVEFVDQWLLTWIFLYCTSKRRHHFSREVGAYKCQPLYCCERHSGASLTGREMSATTQQCDKKTLHYAQFGRSQTTFPKHWINSNNVSTCRRRKKKTAVGGEQRHEVDLYQRNEENVNTQDSEDDVILLSASMWW